jgi:hypothetical protein
VTGLRLAGQLAGTAAPVGRDEARQAAERELSKGVYHDQEPNLAERALQAVFDWLNDVLSRAAEVAPGGGYGVLLFGLLLVGLTVLVATQVGPLRRGSRGSGPTLELSGPLGADEHRRRADAFAGQGRFAEAVRERMRAIVRELETRGVIEPRPGRTADEVAREAGRLVPTVAPDLLGAAGIFDEVWYGGRPATAEADAAVRQADQRVRNARLALGGTEATPAGGYQVPR